VSYPEKVLADDEQVVAHLHPHWITLVPATLWFILICGLAGVGIGFSRNMDDGTGKTVVLVAIIVVAVILLSFLTFKPWIQWRTTHYVLTTHRVLIRRGVLRHVGRDISLQRINDVAFTQSLWDRMVGAGTLVIESAGEQGQETLTNIPRSNQQQQLINRLIEEDSTRRQRSGYQGFQQQGPPPQQGYPAQQQGYPAQQQGYPAQQPNPQPGYPQQGPPYPPTQQYPPQ
jgi:uncharacterized membrane protein YdbT with pleckstrin-like domain